MCCDAADPPPADPRQGEALIRQTQVAENMSNYMIAADQRNQSRLDAQAAQNSQLNNAYMNNLNLASQRASDQFDFYKQNGMPMIQSAFNDAKNFDSASSLAALRGQASADVEQAFAQQSGANQRALQRAGVNPSSGRAQAALAQGGAQAALAKVGTANQMTEARKLQGVGLRQQAGNMANGLPANALGMMNSANQSAAGAGALGAQGIQSALAAQSMYGQGMGQVGGMYGSVAQGFNGMYGNQINAWNGANQAAAAQSSGYGAAAGAALAAYAIFSDRRMKENIVPVGKLSNGLTLYAFDYKPEFKDACGHDTYYGVMADEVEQVIPDAVITRSDGYKMVDYSKVM